MMAFLYNTLSLGACIRSWTWRKGYLPYCRVSIVVPTLVYCITSYSDVIVYCITSYSDMIVYCIISYGDVIREICFFN